MAEQDDAPTIIPESPPRKRISPMREEHEDKDFDKTLAQLDECTVKKARFHE